MNDSELIAALARVVGAAHVLTEDVDVSPYLVDWRKRYIGTARAVVRPGSTAEVAALVQLCDASATAIVPQGGNTGLVGGGTPDSSGGAIVLSTTRMNAIRAIDTINDTITVEAGCVLASVQTAAHQAERLLPLSLAAEGSCTIGGNLSTNAGGTGVLRYGNARELCLGIEAVLPNGQVVSSLRGLRKDNTGYDWKDLLIGAEGTLGVVTAAVMKLFPLPHAQITALAAVASPRHALALLGLAKSRCGAGLTAFELISDFALSLVERHFPAHRSPFSGRHPYSVLLELSDHEDEAHARALFERLMQEALDAGLVVDAVVAESIAQSRQIWELRELISEAQAAEGRNIKHDISVPISRIADFIETTDAALTAAHPALRMVTFGHLGDGNLHYNVSPPANAMSSESDEAAFLTGQGAINRLVHDAVAAHGGSISAEHGIGQLKRAELTRYKSAAELDLMRAIKMALDPRGIMNPGKIL